VRDGVEITEQSIRFTVVDPLVTRLERHDQLSGQLTAREQLARECRALRESVEQMKATGKPETDEKRRQSETKLAALLMEIDGIQRELLPGIGALFLLLSYEVLMMSAAHLLMIYCAGHEENLTHGHGFTNQNDLFAAMVSVCRSLLSLLVSYTDDVYLSLCSLASASRDLLLQRQQVALPTSFDD
jgi:hypothetical protein